MSHLRNILLCVLQWVTLTLWGQTSCQIGDLYTFPDGTQGVVYYLFPDGSGGWTVALNDLEVNSTNLFKWCQSSGDYILIDSFAIINPGVLDITSDTAGYLNTFFLREHFSDAALNVDFEHGWYIPALSQLSRIFAYLSILEPVLQQNGTILATNCLYWSSTGQSDSYSWTSRRRRRIPPPTR